MPYKDREKRLEYSRLYSKIHYECNKEYYAEKYKTWVKNNPDKVKKIKAKCNKKNSHKYSKYSKEYRKKNPLIYKAHLEFKNALRNGLIKRESCVICGKENAQGHHYDYNKPLDVIWLCPKHHADVHKLIKSAVK